ncbi:hypothetical protein [Chelativorans sp. M5D2P16]|uniref:hypothetical protein n=1 Tax=Chelativorans sp. M5D2P16 TaxID=3095678 RepID=UPI002ACA4BE6|nr:hypothetical protein [Chelativorans sp. M5D2P16]MDZ5697637.1 hypothetical protein [Chelativorans sp. M5D2P16]
MNKDMKNQPHSDQEKEKIRKASGDKPMKEGGTAGGLDERTKHGLGETEDKIRKRLKDKE